MPVLLDHCGECGAAVEVHLPSGPTHLRQEPLVDLKLGRAWRRPHESPFVTGASPLSFWRTADLMKPDTLPPSCCAASSTCRRSTGVRATNAPPFRRCCAGTRGRPVFATTSTSSRCCPESKRPPSPVVWSLGGRWLSPCGGHR